MKTHTSRLGIVWENDDEGVWIRRVNGKTQYSVAKRHGRKWVIYEGYLMDEICEATSFAKAIGIADGFYSMHNPKG